MPLTPSPIWRGGSRAQRGGGEVYSREGEAERSEAGVRLKGVEVINTSGIFSQNPD
jgi:hypothetical protein